MNSPSLLIMASVLTSAMRCGCSEPVQPMVTDTTQSMVLAMSLFESGATSLGDRPREYAARRIVDALRSADEAQLIAAVEATYDPEVLAQRNARNIVGNMPALVQQLSGAQLVRVQVRTEAKITLKMRNAGVDYGLDLFFRPSDKIGQMAFGRLG